MLQGIQSPGQFLLPAGCQGNHQGVDDAEGSNQTVHQGHHVALGHQNMVTALAQRGLVESVTPMTVAPVVRQYSAPRVVETEYRGKLKAMTASS